MSFIDAKPTDPTDQLLSDITVAAANQRHAPSLPLRPFAALMVKLADQTGETIADLKDHITKLNQQNARLQFWVLTLAIAALIGTFVQTAVAIYTMPSLRLRQSSPALLVEPHASVASAVACGEMQDEVGTSGPGNDEPVM